ncbi:MAG: hypothetical protein OXE77_01205 [Flavobacteriaceae bacterium]|nr:hypothetical protein [Flavobacteriaceae bacterium]
MNHQKTRIHSELESIFFQASITIIDHLNSANNYPNNEDRFKAIDNQRIKKIAS